MDLKINCKKIEIDGWDCNYKQVGVSLENIDTNDINTVEVAKEVSLENVFEAHGEEAIWQFVKDNYDWFDNE